MAKFKYKAKDTQGKVLIGVIEADERNSAFALLADEGHVVEKIEPYKKAGGLFAPKVSMDVLIMFTQQLSAMFSAGISMLMALTILWKQTEDEHLQLVISEIKKDVEQGLSLSAAMEKHPEAFNETYTSLVEVAEKGGVLNEILKSLAEHLNRQKDLQMKLQKALTYPMIIVVVAGLVVVGMLVGIVPIFQRVFERMDLSLPMITRVLLALSGFLVRFWWLFIFIIPLVIVSFIKYKKSPQGRYKIDGWSLRIPLLGKLNFSAAFSSFSHSFALLLDGGVTIAQSVESSKKSCANKVMEEKFEFVQQKISEGESIGEAMEKTGFFPMFVTQMISVGEQSGSLSPMVKIIADHLDSDVDFRLSKFIAALEPISIVLLGAVVLFVLIAIYAPIVALWLELGSM